jgi:DNA-binding SARP family transcriptional activator
VGELRLRVLGAFEVEGVDALRLGARKARTLLKVLALARGRPVSVDRLVDCLWPAEPPARPAAEVAVLVSRLRSVLGADRLMRSDAGYELRADWLDLDALAELAHEGSRRLEAGSWALARTAAGAALALDRGGLLADEPDAPWAEVERAAAARLVSQARHTAARAALAAGDPLAATEAAESLLDHDPYDEAALQVLMAAHTAAGRPASALAAYGRARARLAEDLGVSPSPATEAVHTAILREEPIPGVVVGSPSAMGVTAPAGEAVLPGRDTELAALDAALERAAAGGPEIVAVEGEAGIGKTRLLSVWSARARAVGATVLSGRCDELDRSLPLEAVVDALARHLRSVGPEAAARILGADGPTLAPLLGRATAAGETAPPVVPVVAMADPATGRAVLFDALLTVLGRAAGDAPAVLLLDDAHLAGASTIDWLRFAARRRSDLRLVVVAARRPEEGLALPATGTIALGPLDLDAAEAVVGPERAAALHARSGGHPLFLVELAAAEGAEELPASIREAVAARCDRAGASAAATLRTAAVIGGEVDLDLLAGVLRLPPVDLLDHLEEGVRRRLLVESGSAFVFRHELMREALAAGTSASRRALVHREAGRVLAARPYPDPLAVAYHSRLGGDDERAAAALCEAARLASERHDHAEAERRLDQAIALHDVPEARLQRARARINRQEFAGAAEDAAVALGQGGGAPALEAAGWAAYYRRDIEGARRLADDGAALAGDPLIRASCLCLGGYVRMMAGELRETEARLEEAAALAQGPAAVVAAAFMGTLRVYQGRAAEGLELLRPATLPGAPNPALFGFRARAQNAYALGLLGRAGEALAAFDDMGAEVERRGVDRYRGMVGNFRGWILRHLGASSEADEANQRSLEVSASLREDDRFRIEPMAHSLLDLAEGRLQAGDLVAARSLLSRVEPLQQVAHALRWRHELRARLLGGRLALGSGLPEAAEATAAAVADDAGHLGAERYVALARLLEARARAAAGEPLDLTVLGALIEALPRLAGLEAWWLTAEMAAAAGVDAWWSLAEQRASDLAKEAGPHAETLRRYATARLERMRTGGRRG